MSLTGTGNDATTTAANSPFVCSERSGSRSYYGSSSKDCINCEIYLDSLLSLEEEDSEWISDSKPCGCSSENPSTPLSIKFDSSSVNSDLDKGSYWDSSLNLEGEGCEWISDSAPALECFWYGSPRTYFENSWGCGAIPSASTVSSLTRVHCTRTEDNVSEEHLLQISDMEEFSADVPLFWPFEGKFNWNSEDSCSSFCISPRRMPVFGSRSTTSGIKESKHRGYEAACMSSKSSAKTKNSELNDEKVVLKEVLSTSNKLSSHDKTIRNEDYASNIDLPLTREDFSLDQGPHPIETLVGLKEFDGHEGLVSEFNGDAFMLEEPLQIIQAKDL